MSPFATKAKMAAAGVGGGAEFFVGSFTKINTVTTQAVTGVGFTPVALLLWTSGSPAASGTFNGQIIQCIGMTSGAAESYAVSGQAADAVTTSNTARRIAAKALTMVDPNGSGVTQEADLDSFDSDGFTLDWTTNSAAGNYASQEIMFLAVGGDGVSAKVVNWTSPTSTGNKAVTGVGFQPDVVLHATSLMTVVPGSSSQMEVGFGVMDSAGGQWTTAVFSEDGQTTSDTYRYQVTDACITNQFHGTVTLTTEAAFVSMDSDGFTVNFTDVETSAYQHISLCLSGVSATAGSFTSTAGGGDQSITGVGFEPSSVLFAATGSSGSILPANQFGMGATDFTNDRCAGHYDRDNVGTTESDSLWFSDACLCQPVAFNANNIKLISQSSDADGFTVGEDGTTSGLFINYLALG